MISLGVSFTETWTFLTAGQKIGELGEFVIVGGEERAGAGVFLEVLDDGPGDGEAVEGGGAAADFVEEDEARGRGVIEDAGDFAHLDEERGAAAGEIVAGTDAREDAVDDGELGLARGNERAGLAPSGRSARLGGDRWTCRPCSGR